MSTGRSASTSHSSCVPETLGWSSVLTTSEVIVVVSGADIFRKA